MSCTANLQMQLGPQLHETQYEWPQSNLGLGITVECPYCGGKIEIIGGWSHTAEFFESSPKII